ncbi:M23 family metallopeptidase [Modestobacter italicus]|uniref:M23 family metallopeptidase n=1 Tax=Modestobacter italicus (strain DSM 44449 / CECT 9708 / BC 501) TaxID=2732864 RepID=UPI001FE260A0|nr:M23 family metallopeptidase [Modestobacter italicus]
MDPQHLARLDDDGTVSRSGSGPVGGPATGASPESPEVPALAAVLPFRRTLARRSRRLLGATPLRAAGVCPAPRPAVEAGPAGSPATAVPAAVVPTAVVPDADAWPLPVDTDGLALADAWPLPVDVDALLLDGAATEAPEQGAAADGLTPEQVVAAVAAGARHRRPPLPARRPALYLAAALIGAAGLAVAATGDPAQVAQAADAEEPISVAEELGLVQAEQPALTGEEATDRLQDMVATRAQREDAQVAAAQVQADADRVAAEAAAAAAAEAARPKAVLPVQGARLTSGFGYRWGTLHAGIDFAAPLGTPEYAAMDGVVVRAGAASGFGLAVYVQHENGDVTVYGHMQEILVEEGQTVKAGDTIALLGNQGQSTGPHLHFEVHVGGIDGERIDPLPWLRERGVQV